MASPPQAWSDFGWGPPFVGDEAAWLKERAELLKEELEQVEKRLEELSGKESR